MPVSLPKLLGLEGEAAAGLDRYVVDGYLGEGATAKVLLARDTRLGRDVAVKLRFGDDAATADEAMRFHREAKALAQVEHPNVVRVIDYSGPDCRTPFLIIERVQGVDLATLVSNGALSEDETCAVGYMLASAIAAIHERGIIHRDVKPENAMLSKDGRVVLIDFGFCKGLLTESMAPGETFIDKPTKCVGTPAFASPEQLRGLRLTFGTDVFSLGSTLYFLATERLPFSGATLRDTMIAVMKKPPFPLHDLIHCSPDFEALLMTLLDKDIVKRETLIGDAKSALFRLGARSGKPFDEVCKALAAARNAQPPPARSIDGEGNNLSHLRRQIVGSAESFDEVTQWTARHAPTVAVTVTAPAAATIAAKPSSSPADETTIRNPQREKQVRNAVAKVRGRKRTTAYAIAALAAALALLTGFAIARLVLRRTPTPIAAQPAALQPPPPLPLPPAMGRLRIAVKPWGKVTIDGIERGVTPELRTIELSAGAHKVVVENPKHGKVERVVEVEAGAGETLAVFELTR